MTAKGSRGKDNFTVVVDGVEMDYRALAEHLGIKQQTVQNRLSQYKRGLMSFKTLVTPGYLSTTRHPNVKNMGSLEWQAMRNRDRSENLNKIENPTTFERQHYDLLAMNA